MIYTDEQGWTISTRIGFGSAARNNRGRYTGIKIHRLQIFELVGLSESAKAIAETTGSKTFAGQFLRGGSKPVTISVAPICGCTGGQFAGQELRGVTAEQVNCSKCS